ncbi:pyruvate ferredoxin oxidoreductase [Candidatus Geothermarchaeota archaeon]|nr:MAG: pyruvate ferredoxin oxidoreductase [Candidatus Geothermarchaeota archaeon]
MYKLSDFVRKKNILLPGHRMCAGCNAPIIVKMVSMALKRSAIIVVATGCLEVATTIFPYTSWSTPWIHNAFENAAATASGIESALKVLKRKGLIKEVPDVIVFAGDGGTTDIGLQALSGAVERGHKFLYVLYDNEAYMNTGIQRSGSTPYGAWTTTTPAGKLRWRKPISKIIAAHGKHVYVATVSSAYWVDFIKKVEKGLDWNGPAFIHAFSTCDRGWRHDTHLTIKISRLAVQTCFFPLWEYEDGKYTLSSPSRVYAENPEKKVPVEEFLKVQGRFSHLFKPRKKVKMIEEIQRKVDEEWNDLLKLTGYA